MGINYLIQGLIGCGRGSIFFPSAAKAVSQWVPRNERGRAIATYDSQSKLSNAIGAPILALVVTEWGWRGGFFW
ncbi:hypothetical protein GCM10020331_026280 [Ectobacillus funiculus]